MTPLHTDPHHNLLVQVVGTKYVRLYSPAHSAALYPFPSGITTNSSQVDLLNPDTSLHPDFTASPFLETELGPGQTLYIPPGAHHRSPRTQVVRYIGRAK